MVGILDSSRDALLTVMAYRWSPFDAVRNYPDLGPRFIPHEYEKREENEERSLPTDLPWSAVMKRTFEAYIRGEQPNMYGEWIRW